MPFFIFKSPKNKLEGGPGPKKLEKAIKKGMTDDLLVTCPKCKKEMEEGDLSSRQNVCVYCAYHFRVRARQRLNYICDRKSFSEMDAKMESTNILAFPDYDKKLQNAKLSSNESDAVVCGTCSINGIKTAVFVMDPYFMMGSMGVVVGEKITRLFERATNEKLPVVGFTVSGGARMQEGILSLMQMAKISGAVKRHSDAGLPYIGILTDPTTGGVTASFAMEADIILAEPDALIGFAGPRVIEQTIRKKLPDGFQRSAFLLEKGFVDEIVDRTNHRKFLTRILKLHGYKKD
jgi:acetyl-CoA carboxylase carboxyl transferase subunit beta